MCRDGKVDISGGDGSATLLGGGGGIFNCCGEVQRSDSDINGEFT